MNLDDTVCYCFHITKRKIVNFLRVERVRRASQLSECGGAGTGCGWCIPYLTNYFQESQQGEIADEDDISPADYARGRGEYIHTGKGCPPPGAIPPPAPADE